MSTESCRTHLKRLVRWNINYIEQGLAAPFPPHEELIRADMSAQEFETWKIAQFVEALPYIDQPPLWKAKNFPPAARDGKINALPPGAGKYLRVVVATLDTFKQPSWDFEETQVRLLREIREAIEGRTPPHPHPTRIRLPKTGLLAGQLVSDLGRSEFGDEFVNMPAFMGAMPKPGHTILSGWIELEFRAPVGDLVEFVFRWAGVGTPVVIQWGGGMENLFTNNRTFPTAALPLIDTESRGTLNLKTGEVTCPVIFATFQATTIAGVTRKNRIPNLFPYMYPPPQVDPGALPLPPDYQPPNPFPPVFAKLGFTVDTGGKITGFELHSESFAPEGIFPYFKFLPPPMGALFPPFAWGPDFGIFWVNPWRCKAGTPPDDCPSQATHPDGIRYPISVYFHPHIDLTSRTLVEVERFVPPPVESPKPVADALLLAADGRLYQIGGTTQGGVSNEVWTYDLAARTWAAGPKLPHATSGAQGVALNRRLYVFGGWATPGKKIVARIQIFDLDSDSWDECDWDDPVAEGTATAVGQEVYVISGLVAAKGGAKLTDAVQIFDSRNGVWGKGQPASMPAAAASAVAVGKLIYLAGGQAEGGLASRRTVVYNTETDVWQLGPDLDLAAYGAALGRYGDEVYLVGGRGEDDRTMALLQILEIEKNAWRKGLPPALPVASAGAAFVGDTFLVLGGRVQVGSDDPPGSLTSVAQAYHPNRGWRISAEAPVFTSVSVMNAAGVTVGPEALAPGSQAFLLAENIFTPQGPVPAKITVGGLEAPILGALPPVPPAPARIVFLVPPFLDAKSGRATLELSVQGSPRQAPPVEIPVAAAAPGLFIYSFGEVSETWFLDSCGALACNQDGSLNFADQPAAPGQLLTLWATGLGKDAEKKADKLEVRFGEKGELAKIESLQASAEIPGVWTVTVRVPKGTGFSNNEPVVLTAANGIASNRAVVSIREKALRPETPVPCAVGVEFVFKLSFPPPAFRLGCAGEFVPLG